ncbi:SET domain-containing protein [Parachaetomium inaequale]|uniref:SET domain-containing protein n=1 Tax=Parachaetomium inaequale TaxID=2588326 RepID=A0AAN6SUF5_9PEZI|nr:SET domain-containing protein [Parachaetomium inaequale]
MDIHDVSDTPQYVQVLLDQQAKLRDAQAHKGQRPARTARAQVILEFQLNLMASRGKVTAGGQQTSFIRSSFVPPPYPPCVVSLSDLKKTMINDLLLETHHRGTYLLVRSVTPQDRMTAVMAIVEDEKGDVLMVQLYHQGDDEDGGAEDILVEGMVLILKEPYLKLMSDGNYGLRVDHLSDVVFLSANDERIPSSWKRESAGQNTALAWKTKGNSYSKKSAYRSAIEWYNRRYDAALSDVESAMTTATVGGKPAEKALFRKAEALYSLERYRECCEVLKELCLAYPDNTSAKTQLTRAVSRLAEQTNGRYPFKQLHAETARLRPPLLDHATYIGPVSVQAAGPRGRGLFTTRAVKAGELLFCEKAFAHAFVDKEEGRGFDTTMLIDLENGGTMGAQSDLINMTVRKLYQNPSLIPIITSLHRDSYQPVDATEVDGQPVVDTFLIRRIIALNSFGCPLSTLTSHRQRQRQPNPTPEKEEDGDGGGGDSGVFHSCGLWPTASLINHSCAGTNARRAFVGDLLVARATRDLAPHTELTWWYQPPGPDNYAQRREKLQRNWGFVCDCAMCEDEQGTSKASLDKRRGLAAGLGAYLSSLGQGPHQKGGGGESGDAVAARIEAVLGAMAATYSRPASEVPRLAVWEAMQGALMTALGMRAGHRQEVQPRRVVKLLLAALGSLGYVIEGGVSGTMVVRQWGLLVDGVMGCWMLLRDAYCLAAPELVVPAEGYARTAYRMVFGEDETFETYGEA